MAQNRFSSVRIDEKNEKWEQCISRLEEIYSREDDIRTDFMRDYNRILHSNAYRRLKHKTQIFFATRNDHICTRIEHVNHVAAISYTISRYLGLNTDLCTAIAIGHDLGHAPFGHEGEGILRDLSLKYLGESFEHEKNSLWIVDNLETLTSPEGKETNLNLTYAIRDGIVCHCGEVSDEALFPRREAIDLAQIQRASEVFPFTWEGCVAKVADKIAFLGRDIEDALNLEFITEKEVQKLQQRIEEKLNISFKKINNTNLIHRFIIDLCNNSSPEEGIKLSEKYLDVINELQDFSREHIYKHRRLSYFKEYAKLIINSIFDVLYNFYDQGRTIDELNKYDKVYPNLVKEFRNWLFKYSDADRDVQKKFGNKLVYEISSNKGHYIRAIIDFIAGMTDSFAIKIFGELTSF